VEKYAVSFQKHKISGEGLGELTRRMLGDPLGISNSKHKDVFMSAIKSLFTKQSTSCCGMSADESLFPKASTPCCGSGYISGCASELSGVTNPMPAESSEWGSGTSYSNLESNTVGLSSCWSQNASSCIAPSSSSINTGAARRIKKLKLSLKPGQIDRTGNIKHIRNWFIARDPSVDVQRTDKANTYIIAFQNANDAWEAFIELKNNGFQVGMMYPNRPRPKSPKKYKSLEKLIIREGKSFKKNKVGEFEKDQTLFVDQVKGRRARIKSSENGQTLGWVSIYSRYSGKPLLSRAGE